MDFAEIVCQPLSHETSQKKSSKQLCESHGKKIAKKPMCNDSISSVAELSLFSVVSGLYGSLNGFIKEWKKSGIHTMLWIWLQLKENLAHNALS